MVSSLKDKTNGLAVAVTMPVHAFQRLYSDHELLRSLADRNKNHTESSFTEEDLATAQIALALDVLVNTAELDTQVDIYQQGISHFREIYGCKTSSITSGFFRDLSDQRMMSSAFKQSLHPDYLMVEYKARERSFDSRQTRRGDDDDVDDSIVPDVLTPPDYKVCDKLKLKQVRESVLDN